MLLFNLRRSLLNIIGSVDKRVHISQGLLIATFLILIWTVSIIFLLSLDLSQLPLIWIPVAILWQTFLYTGLFITAHDSMHGAVAPHNPKLNYGIGTISVLLYALFSYQKLLKKHWLHHHYPASSLDPDFHDDQHTNFFSWYFHFMKEHFSWTQLGCIVMMSIVLKFCLHLSELNLILFWMFPSLLSSLQLFYFGTFLPHRKPIGGYVYPHRAQTSHLSTFWSFITCYHFGYHQEHHQYPSVPWWKLPKVYAMGKM
jgi:beta-carotene/zeaxanthin 4-ketolase